MRTFGIVLSATLACYSVVWVLAAAAYRKGQRAYWEATHPGMSWDAWQQLRKGPPK